MVLSMGAAGDERIARCITVIEQLKRGDFDASVLNTSDPIGQALQELAHTLTRQAREQRWLDQITLHINAGLLLDDVMQHVYDDFRDLIPYNRIGLALIEDDGQTVRSRWAKSDHPPLKLRRDYAAPLAGSSLETIIATGEPRILNDLEDYLLHKPDSESTHLIMSEGIRSSLTCPLIANGEPVGFLFFSSVEPHIYRDVHIDIFRRIATQLSGIVERGRLVSDLAAQKNAIERQNQELQALNELKNNFLGMAVHDLRSPLGMIEMALAFMLDPGFAVTEDEAQAILLDVRRQAEHMLRLIDNLLDVTQIEAGKLELSPESIDLGAFLDEAVRRHTRLAAPKGTRICFEAILVGAVTADPYRLRQVVDNLISNAIKYSPAGSTVRVGAQPVTGGWRIYVQDEGPGIQPDERSRLFQDFVRLSAQPTGGETSTGLGLAITRRIVEAHGGRVGVDSEPGQGAIFWFTLPA